MKFFYEPEGAAFGDCMPMYWDGLYYLFHQRDPALDAPLSVPIGWALETTPDFVTFTDHGEVIPGGTDDDTDRYIFAGSVRADGEGGFVANYTGFNNLREGSGRPTQVLMRASSEDLVDWTKEGAFELPPQPGYDLSDWRDPFVFWDDEAGQWMLILGTRKEGPKILRNGSTVWFSSPDAKEWTFEGDLYAPGLYTGHEMPDEFAMGDKWYLLTTEYSDKSKTVYVLGESARGPWRRPTDDAFDGRAYYAARSASNGDRRFLFGWVANKKENLDSNTSWWGGTLVVHEVIQRADGTLGVTVPEELFSAVMSGAVDLPSRELVSDGKRESLVLAEASADSYGLEAEITVAEGTRQFTLLFGGDSETDDWYGYRVDLNERRLTFDRFPNWPWNRYDNKGLERPLPDDLTEHPIKLRLLVDEGVAVLYLNDIALSARINQPAGAAIGIEVEDGTVSLSGLRLAMVTEDLSPHKHA